VYTMPINWGLSIFGANVEAWNALSPELRTSLKQELPKLELAIWNESERETGNGIACNIGSSSCVDARKYKLTAVKPVPIDDTKRRTIFANTVLSRWVHRCGAQCAEVWNQTIASVVGMQAKKTVNNPTAQ